MVAASCGNRALNVDVGIIDCFSAKIGKIGERGKGIAEKIHEKQGFWEEATGGTLFLDEIGNLPLEVQQMLLRALESKHFRPLGSAKDKKADVRIIAATNEDLQTAIAEKRFWADLYQRLKEYTLHIPPLRECKEDILPLADFFLKLANDEFEKQVKGFDAEARKRLLDYTWGGNVRELKRVVRMAVLHTEGDTIMANTLECAWRCCIPKATQSWRTHWSLTKIHWRLTLHWHCMIWRRNKSSMRWNRQRATARWLRRCSASDELRYIVR